MSHEFTPQSPKTFQELKEEYKQRLDQILYRQLTVDNIESFADEALNDLVSLTADVLNEYRTNPNFTPNKPDPLWNDQEQENDAFEKLELIDIQGILERVEEMRAKVEGLKKYIEHYTEEKDEVIIPPQEGQWIQSGSGDGIEDKKLVPRLLTLLYLLETDLEIAREEIKIVEGKVTPDMMRQTPYIRVDIVDLDRTVYLCDEEGNASYIFDTEKLKEKGLSVDNIDLEDKGSKNELINRYPDVGAKVVQSLNWRKNIESVLLNPISVYKEIPEDQKLRHISEFLKKEKQTELSFEDFQTQVKEMYDKSEGKKGDVQKWYKIERISHPDWPRAPYATYKDKEWQGWPELVGKENKFKIEYLNYDDLKREVMLLYSGETDVREWYSNEKPNHTNWPFNPDKFFRQSADWQGWPELVDRQNKYKHPPFSDFQNEVREVYSDQERGPYAWYRQERQHHPAWPSTPDKFYKKEGWSGWPELVGKENRLKREILPYGEFEREVRTVYSGQGDVTKWYKEEEWKKHKNWPSNPNRKYKDKGWRSWAAMVGKE